MPDDLSKTARIPSTRSSRLATDRSTTARRTRFVAEYLIDHNWVEMAAKPCELLTEQVQMVDHRHVEDTLIEAHDRAVKLGQAKTKKRAAR